MWQSVDPYWDDKLQSTVYGFNGNWLVSVTRMLFTDRICLTSTEDYPSFYTAGWDYEQGQAALAAMLWDPEDEWEPKGYIRCACDSRSGRLDR